MAADHDFPGKAFFDLEGGLLRFEGSGEGLT
jgi:hypothetical protein